MKKSIILIIILSLGLVGCAGAGEKEVKQLLIGASVLIAAILLLIWITLIRRKRKDMKLRIYKRTCLVIFEDFKHSAKIGMTSKQFSSALDDTAWIEKSFIYPITALSGWIPLEWYSNSICYCINLYPDTNDKSNYAIWFRILHPQESIGQDEIGTMGIKFLKGELTDEAVTLQEFTLCTYKTEEFEFFPQRDESEEPNKPNAGCGK